MGKILSTKKVEYSFLELRFEPNFFGLHHVMLEKKWATARPP